jgi:hypothetical protein
MYIGDRQLCTEYRISHRASSGPGSGRSGTNIRDNGRQHLPGKHVTASAIQYATSGSAAHPGGGVMGACGRNAAQAMIQDQ